MGERESSSTEILALLISSNRGCVAGLLSMVEAEAGFVPGRLGVGVIDRELDMQAGLKDRGIRQMNERRVSVHLCGEVKEL